MSERVRDVVIVGGGVAGAACAHRLAAAGADVLVLEREHQFVDRVRGDVVYPWGVREAVRLGLMGALGAVSRPVRYWRTRVVGLAERPPRDMAAESGGLGVRAFLHPELQTALLGAAERAGAEVVRGTAVTQVRRLPGPERLALVEARVGTTPVDHPARLVIGADGRGSRTRAWGGFELFADPAKLMFAGVLLVGAGVGFTTEALDTAHVFLAPATGLLATLVPLDASRTRAYLGYHLAAGRHRLGGPTAFPEFSRLSAAAGVPPDWLAGAEVAGPLSQFPGADTWVDPPYLRGVALVGDAAGAADPSFGCGVALALRGAARLTAALLRAGSFAPQAVDEAGEAYAGAARADFAALHRQTSWLADLFRAPGPAADAVRASLFPLYARDPDRVPDVVLLGPDGPSDDGAKRRFLGLE